jgi:hypothetical protein
MAAKGCSALTLERPVVQHGQYVLRLPWQSLDQLLQQGAIGLRARRVLIEQPINIHLVLSADKDHAVRDGWGNKLHLGSSLVALRILV